MGDIISNSVNINGAGTPTLSSNSNLTLAALQRVVVLRSPLRLYNVSTTSRDTDILVPLNGDLIYNTTLSGIEYYDGRNWINSTANSNRVVILSTGEVTINSVTPDLSANRNALNVRGTMVVCSEISTLTALSALSGASPGQFSAGGLLVGQNEGGAYLGRVSVRESSWQVVSGTEGVNWTVRDSQRDWYDVAMSSDGRIQTATVTYGLIYTSTDYGVTWTGRDSSRGWYGVAMSSDGRIQTAVVGAGGGGRLIYTSTDYGVTWTGRDSSRFWRDVAMSSDGRIQTATVNNGLIYTSTDYGVTWTPRDSQRVWYGVAMSSDGRIQTATVTGGLIYTSTDYGVTWTGRDSANDWNGVAMSSDGRIQTATANSNNNGRPYTSTDYGVTWTRRDSQRTWRDVAMSSDGRIQTATVTGGLIYTSTDYGVTWTGRDSSRGWNGVAISSDGRIMTAVVGNIGRIYTSTASTVTPNPITVLGAISSTAVIYASGGNSNQWSSAYTTLCTISATWTLVNVISSDSISLTIDNTNHNTYQNQILHTRNTSPARINFEQSLPAGFNMMVLNDSTQNVTLTSSVNDVFYGYGTVLSGSQGTKQLYTAATIYKYGNRIYATGALV